MWGHFDPCLLGKKKVYFELKLSVFLGRRQYQTRIFVLLQCNYCANTDMAYLAHFAGDWCEDWQEKHGGGQECYSPGWNQHHR